MFDADDYVPSRADCIRIEYFEINSFEYLFNEGRFCL